MSLSLSDVSTLFGTTASQTSTGSLLQILYGGAAQSAASGGNPLPALSRAEANQTTDIQTTARQPAVARAISQFTAVVKSATSVKGTSNYRVCAVV
ncbi:MAG TPA: hypothetical protein VIJ55_02020 [Acetobacteraceae bacterium]